MSLFWGFVDATIAVGNAMLKPAEMLLDATHAGDIKRTREETLSDWTVHTRTPEATREFKNNPDYIEVGRGKFKRDYVGTHFVRDGEHYYWNDEDNVTYNEALNLSRRRDLEVR